MCNGNVFKNMPTADVPAVVSGRLLDIRPVMTSVRPLMKAITCKCALSRTALIDTPNDCARRLRLSDVVLEISTLSVR
ncbi:hypothetical protein KPSA3_00952 [Pseudomonas syringae pv. actinidiae]|uniref:Uncharacterized protein n=1 Tax=Pseudomonas syringae pv. actinidiae TaxID=103796 RepID=A0AAN4Q0Y4_PSESF|nr:hypothetical protein KPSA3_00952 [Pseudomonas syringae pv. actinidiae]